MTDVSISPGKINKALFVYLTQESEVYYLGDDIGYSVQRRPQLGLQYLCAVLERKGVKTDILDQTVTPFNVETLIDKVGQYDMAGFYCSDSHEDKVKSWCGRIKQGSGIPILVGGPSTLDNTSFLDHGCDIVVHGEGEMTIQDIVDHYELRKEIGDIRGISYRSGDQVMTTPPRELIQDLDQIPFPDRSKVDINAYHDYFIFGMRKPYITIIASRGCVYKCHFCTSYKIWGYKYRRRSVDNVIAEIDEVVAKYGAKYVAFQDDIFGMTDEWVEEFCEKLLRKPYRIRWMAILHPFNFRKDTEKILSLMRRAGCDTLSFGLQAAHPEILKNIGRHPDEPEALKRILKTANALGFLTAVAYIFGLPGDTRETVQTTIDYSLDCGSIVANYYMLSVLKGSDIEKLYRGRKVCQLSQKEIEDLAEHASKRFYMRPKAILRLASFVSKNPRWLFSVGKNIPSILSRVGFGAKHE